MNDMAKVKSNVVVDEIVVASSEVVKPTQRDVGWTDYVLSFLTDDELIKGNPTTDGLRRVFEQVLNCKVVNSSTHIEQSPTPENSQRATVVVTLVYNDANGTRISIDGASDAFWGNTDKVFRNHPVAVAETKAEGRALRRALKLRKVITADEVAEDVVDIDGSSADKIDPSQIEFINTLSLRTDINTVALLDSLEMSTNNIKKMSHKDAVAVVRKLSEYQRDLSSVPESLKGYNPEWRTIGGDV